MPMAGEDIRRVAGYAISLLLCGALGLLLAAVLGSWTAFGLILASIPIVAVRRRRRERTRHEKL